MVWMLGVTACTITRPADNASSDTTPFETGVAASDDEGTLDGPPGDATGPEPSETSTSIDGGEDCGSSLLECGGICIDPTTDVGHCGACDNPCAAGATCEEGTCACPEGEEVCNDACVDTFNDPTSCGACGNLCGTCLLYTSDAADE